MAEYIDRGDLTIWLNKKSCEFSMNDVAPIGWTLKGLVNELATFPSADVVERKVGSWRHYEGELTCSECAATIYDDIMSLLGDDVPRFCPNCGAQMIGGDDDV